MANPLVTQGVLNRLRGSIIIVNSPELNVTAPYLGKEGIGLTLTGETTLYIGTMTGAVTSGEPYQMADISVHLLKTQFLSDTYKQRQESNSILGDIVVRTDSAALGDYQFTNCSIKNISPLSFAGTDAGYVVTLGGVYLINSALFETS